MDTWRSVAMVWLASTMIGAPATAQEPADAPSSIQVTGQATIVASPDQAQIDIGVTTESESSTTAARQNADRLDRVLRELREAAGDGATITTISYGLNPNYRYDRPDGQPMITGYTATNIVRVVLDDLDRVGRVIDVATATGANTIHRLEFALGDDRTMRAQALREAAMSARAEAETLASALDVRIIRVLTVVVHPAERRPPGDVVAFARAESAPTPIEPGSVDVRATITLTVEIEN